MNCGRTAPGERATGSEFAQDGREGYAAVMEDGPVGDGPQPEGATKSPESLRRHRILVVDDEPLLLKSLQRMLRSRHEVVGARGGAQALDVLADDDEFDVIFCDLMMPEVDGIAFEGAVSEQHPHLARKIVFLSGGACSDRVEEFMGHTEHPVLAKPVSLEVLLQTVDEIARA